MRTSLLGLVLLSLVGCALDAPLPELQERSQAATVPTTSGSFQGHYVVPAPADLASAATFAMPEVSWTVANGTATLHYELPLGLVGGVLPITVTGPITSTSTTVQLTSIQGTGSCTAQGTKITCSEAFGNLGTLPMNTAVVQQVATQDSISPTSSRLAVANIFSSDPIGTVDLDLSVPAPDNGGHHGGSGGGGGDGGGGGRGRH